MKEVLIIIEQNQVWIYLTLGLFVIIYTRTVFERVKSLQSAFFGLEKERAREQLFRAIAMLTLIVIGLIVIFIITTFASPAIPTSERPTPMPTVSLLRTVESTPSSVDGTDLATQIPITADISAGCTNPDATIYSPESGSTISGIVEVTGAATMPAFAFYKLEYLSSSPDAQWQAIAAGTQPVCENNCPEDDLLGKWDTGLITAGEYSLRLVVTDASGNAPLPCEILVRILPSE